VDNICGKYNVIFDKEITGTVNISRTGQKYLFECQCNHSSADIIRLFCYSNDVYSTIGTMMPVNGRLYLKKAFTRNDLIMKDIGEINHFLLSSTSPAAPSSPPHLQEIQTEPALTTASQPEEMPEENKIVAYPWRNENSPSSLFSDPELKEVCMNIKDALSSSDGEFIYLAVPVSSDKPFPLMPAFCFGSFELIDNRSYIIFKLKNGNLC